MSVTFGTDTKCALKEVRHVPPYYAHVCLCPSHAPHTSEWIVLTDEFNA